jgi:outer membrane lipoprotein-sorting protein
MRLVMIAVLALLLPQEKNEAETLFRKMEEKLAKAKTVRLKMTGDMDMMKMTLSGEMQLGEEGRMRVDIDGKVGQEAMKAGAVSDGKRLRLHSSDKPQPREFDVTGKLGPLSRTCLARAGFVGALDSFDNEKGVKAEADELFSLSAFKLGAKEKAGEREAQIVDYQIDKKGHRPSDASVWIDVETHLPLKRVLKKGGMTLTESYSEMKLDERIDPATFELPKDAK